MITAAALPSVRPASAFTPPNDPTAGRSLIFDEPFHRLDPAIWNAGRKATTFDAGHYGRAAFARITGEEGFNPYAIVDDAKADDGKALQISVRHIGRPMNVYAYYGNGLPEYQWVSGNIQTARSDGTILKGWRQGYFEARMWMPRHPLTWPGFWMMNGRSILHPQTSVELDIVEHKGKEPTLYGAYLHEWGQPGEHHEGIGVPTGVDVTLGYNLYGMLVDGAHCALYFNRKAVLDPKTSRPVVWTIGRAAELDRNGDVFWPLLTLALRDDEPYPRPLLPEHRLAHLRIDHFRVYG
ncbi:glycoside hydrolase family 16 protein [Phreatobacter aquaticus]|nr:family 16 glycosylhydrolase [Phreatobacter aquaticus]